LANSSPNANGIGKFPDDRRAAHARFRAELTALLGRLTGP
jgi:hypothetical protein